MTAPARGVRRPGAIESPAMNRGPARLLLLLALVLPAPPPRAQPAPSRPPAGKQEKVSPERRAFLAARSQFLYAADCWQRKTCDTAFLEDMERKFLSTCNACDAPDRCEAARVAIRAAESTREMKLCE